jgi:DNA (cytosine-5)-methyltransferase 1
MRLLDLFCCEGAGARGYAAAGFDVVGVYLDGARARHYPYEFHQGDALAFLTEHWSEFDAVHASPPCQAYSITKHSHNTDHPELVEPTRDALVATGLPYVIENVVGAPLLDPVTLCGAAFGLTATDDDGTLLVLKRHRLFETSFALMQPECLCAYYKARGYRVGGAYGGGSSDRAHAQFVRRGGYTPAKHVRRALLGVEGGTLHGLSQAIPPAYTRYIGEQLMETLR